MDRANLRSGSGAEDLRLPIATWRGQLPLSAVASIAPATELTMIERGDRQRLVTVGAGVLGRDLAVVTADARAAVEAPQFPTGVTVSVAGQAAPTDDALSSLAVAMGLSVLFVYMILCAQFASFDHPFTIMLPLPFSMVDALVALFVTGKGLDMLAMIGLILLMGLVTKNSILLVDLADRLPSRGYTTLDALLEAGPVRLRPIQMTTLVMISCMLPLALGIGAGAELRQSMGIGVIGGLLTSTVLTLVAVPVAYSLVDALIARVRRRRTRGELKPQGSVPTRPELASEGVAVSKFHAHGHTYSRSSH